MKKKVLKKTNKNKIAFAKMHKKARKNATAFIDKSKTKINKEIAKRNVAKKTAKGKTNKRVFIENSTGNLLVWSGYIGLGILITAVLVLVSGSAKNLKTKAASNDNANPQFQEKEKPVHIVKSTEIEPFDFTKVDLEKIEFNKKLPILMYHYIEPIDPSQSRLRQNLTVSPEKFEEQMKWLSENGFTTMTLTDYFSKIAEGKELPAKPVLLTFDDGYRNFYLNAAPILNKYSQKATTFIISGSVGYPAYMTWDMIRELYKQGYEFGSHSVSHANLKSLKESKLEEELQDSKWEIEKEIGGPVNFMCYPSGFFDSRVINATRTAQYKGAVTTGSGMDVSNKNIFEMYRYRISDGMGIDRFAWTVNQAYQ
ncbi:MAG TPA: polysaccharide deacetylase family protein [Patescibacteria group bacterium]|nr:polysaccharide deacetylase family protein [Patescibacteria group bacterium]